jgi:hypothetical protein
MQLYRFVLALSLGVGLAALAMQPSPPRIASKKNLDSIVLATALERAPAAEVGARADQCSLNPRDYADDRPIGDKSGKDHKKKVIACG